MSIARQRRSPIVLAILDGWGFREEVDGNAIALARTPFYDRLLREYPHTLLRASEQFVGLPDGQMGNSEVGHLNLGAGRVVSMDVTRIDAAIADGSFAHNPAIVRALDRVQKEGTALHLLGLLSDGGVHSHERHLYELLRIAARRGLEKVFVHAFMDGRDTMPTSGLGHLAALAQQFREAGCGELASVSGRYYAMDRDLRWEKERQAFDAMVLGTSIGGVHADAERRVRELYNNDITDEFIPPFSVAADSKPVGPVRDGDVCLCFNYRADRVRQITRVLARNVEASAGLTSNNGLDLPRAAELDEQIPRHLVPRLADYVCMTQYDKSFQLPVIVPPQSMDHLLANILAEQGLRNLRVAETEKYAHVTYFFNGGVEKPFAGEERELISSQKVATYDLAPEMSAVGIADAVIKATDDTAFDLVIVNFANADMVGHSGKLEPTVKAVEVVDSQLQRIYDAIRRNGGEMLITADHGNAELLIDPLTRGPHTAHTTNPVPCIYVGQNAAGRVLRPGGSLQDVAPTVLGMLRADRPADMTGQSLFGEDAVPKARGDSPERASS